MTSERKFHPSMLWYEHHNPLAECLFKFRPPTRCGSYPFMNIAEDFGLPYATVLLIADYYIDAQWNEHIVRALGFAKGTMLHSTFKKLQEAIYNANRSQR